jgi:hypothetical protein
VLARYEIEGRVEFGRRAGAQDKDLLAKSVCCGLNLMNLVGGIWKAGINQNANGFAHLGPDRAAARVAWLQAPW